VADPGETRDVIAEQSERFQAMVTLYEQYKLDNGVLDPPKRYNHQPQVVLNGLHDRFRAHLLLGLFMIVIAVVFIVIAKHHRSR
jgi:hypothetical protein